MQALCEPYMSPVCALYKPYLRNCMAEDLLQNTYTMIGGPGTVVEIDSSLFGKRNYNRGRQVRGTLILVFSLTQLDKILTVA